MNDQTRILNIFLRLESGERLTKNQLARDFEVSEKSIQRDFSLLADFIENHPSIERELLYDSRSHARYFSEKTRFEKKDILVISKIMLESRALNSKENKRLLYNLLKLVGKTEQNEIRAIIGSELLSYHPITDTQDRIDKVWKLSEFIRREMVIEIDYSRPHGEKKKTYSIFPVSMFFDQNYFYLVAYQMKHKAYITLRIDRISRIKKSQEKKPEISYGQKYRDGDDRNFKVDAFTGPVITVKMEYYADMQVVLDKFPNSRVLAENIVEFQTQYTEGLERWILGQAMYLKVLTPFSLVSKIKEIHQSQLEKYK